MIESPWHPLVTGAPQLWYMRRKRVTVGEATGRARHVALRGAGEAVAESFLQREAEL